MVVKNPGSGKKNSYMNKKGAMEMSLNLIIMLIIGLVILGLVIAFVQDLVSESTSQFDQQLTQQQKKQLDRVEGMSGNIAMLPSTTVNLKKGESQKIYIKLRNPGGSGSSLNVQPGDVLTSISSSSSTGSGGASGGASATGGTLNCNIKGATGGTTSGGTTSGGTTSSGSNFKLQGPGFEISGGKTDAQAYTLEAEQSAKVGNYYYLICTNTVTSDSERITIKLE